jgi:CheY-like chemotaxis protein
MVVYLPVTHELAPARTVLPSPEASTLGGATILVVDDEPTVRSATRSMLEQAGCRVVEAENGREAVSRYRAQGSHVQAVLMDLSMPVMGGEAALRELLAIDPAVKVVLISGYTELETAQNLAGLRPAAFLQKPYRYGQLIDALRSVLR